MKEREYNKQMKAITRIKCAIRALYLCDIDAETQKTLDDFADEMRSLQDKINREYFER